MRDFNDDLPSRGEVWRGGSWVIGLAVVAIVVMLVVGLMWAFGFGLFSRATANERGGTQVREKTVADGNYRIAQYDHFFDLCASVQSDEDTIEQLGTELADDLTPERASQIKSTLTAVRSNRAESINQYNADARKAGTAGQFRDSALPYQLDKKAEATTCTI